MSPPWSIVISTAAAIVATLTGIVVGAFLTRQAQFVQWSRAARLEACTQFLKAYSTVYDGLSHACRHQIMPDIEWTQWNQAVAVLSLVSTRPVMDSAVKVDTLVWEVDASIVKGDNGLERWLDFRKSLEESRLGFVNTARQELAAEPAPLDQVVGASRRVGGMKHPDAGPRS